MSKTKLDLLTSTQGPWIYIGTGEAERKKWIPAHFYSPDNDYSVCVRRLRGWKMRTLIEFMNEIAAALQFFDGFGENWPALEDTLRNLDEWLPADAYIIIIERSEELFEGNLTHIQSLLEIFNRIGSYFAKPINEPTRFQRSAKPFHLLLHVSEEKTEAIDKICEVANNAKLPIITDA